MTENIRVTPPIRDSDTPLTEATTAPIRNRDIWAWGVLGGISPTLAHFAGTASQISRESGIFDITPNMLGFAVGIAAYAFLGGIIARGFGARDVRTALMAGIAAPGIVSSVMSGQTIQRLTNEVNELATPLANAREALTDGAYLSIGIVGAAYAQANDYSGSPGDEITLSSDWVSITPQITGGVPLTIPQVPYNWSIVDPTSGKEQSVPGGVINALHPQVVFVPDGARTLTVNGVDIGVNSIKNPGETVRVEFETKPTVLGDFIWALGGGRDFSISGIQVTLDPQTSIQGQGLETSPGGQ